MELKKQTKILFIVGTRPEAIKICPLIKEASKFFDIYVLGTGQHYESVLEVFSLFGLYLDKILPAKKFKSPGSQLAYYQHIVSETIELYIPNLVVVHGDTTTCFAGTLSAYLHKIDVAHIEAGLRTQNIYAPFPEEMFRKWTDAVAALCFAPTMLSKNNLLNEGINSQNIHVTGNTVVDSLNFIRTLDVDLNKYPIFKKIENFNKKWAGFFLVTLHRNEIRNSNLTELAIKICQISKEKNYFVVWPSHPNKAVSNNIKDVIKKFQNVIITLPIKYPVFIKLMEQSELIITDSGGIQEEATVLGKKILIIRKETERPEVLMNQSAILAGTNQNELHLHITKLLALDSKKINRKQLFGSGHASEKITTIISDYLNKDN